ncbi:MFS transporter [Actinomycetota bacterium]
MGRWGSTRLCLIAAAGFLALALAALLVRAHRLPKAGLPLRWRLLPADGWAVLSRDRLAMGLVLAVFPFILPLEATNVVEVFMVRDILGGTPEAFGALNAAAAVAGLAGAILAGQIGSDHRRAWAIVAGLAVASAGMAASGLAPTLVGFGAAAVAIGLAMGLVNACIFALLLTRLDEADRGKVVALVSGLSRSVTILALTAGGVAATALGPRAAYLTAGVLGLVLVAPGVLVLRGRGR